MSKSIICLAVLGVMMAAAAGCAGPGRATCVASSPYLAIWYDPPWVPRAAVTKPPPDAGTVYPDAVIFNVQQGSSTVQAAIDARKPNADEPDLMRFDFTGRGRFDDQCVCALHSDFGQHWNNYVFTPTEVKATRADGKVVPVLVSGKCRYDKESGSYGLKLEYGAAIQAACAFGGKTYPVRIVDGTGNLRFDDAAYADVGFRPWFAGDTLVIDTGDGDFTNKAGLIRAYYGQPVLVDGRLYDVRLARDESRISASPFTGPTGKIRIDRTRWSGVLVGKQYVLNLVGGAEPVEVPADRYVILNYTDETDQPGTAPMNQVYSGMEQAHVVLPGQTTDIEPPK